MQSCLMFFVFFKVFGHYSTKSLSASKKRFNNWRIKQTKRTKLVKLDQKLTHSNLPTSNVEKNVYIWEMTCKVMGLNCPDPTFILRQSRSIITMRDFNDIY